MGRRRGGRQCFSSYLIRCQILVEIRILVKLDKMLRLDCCVPEKYRKSRISNIAHLECSYCGQVSGEITHLLSWPKDLQTLRISIGIPMGSNRYAFDSPKITSESVPNAIWPSKHCLLALYVDGIDHTGQGMPVEPFQGRAFESLTKLQ